MTLSSTNREVGLVAAFTALAWFGEYLHNRLELPQLTLLSPENSGPAILFLLLFAGWSLLPYKRAVAMLMLIWAVLHLLVGAIITVIPFSSLPFYPAQTLDHYLAHLMYGITQLPLIRIMLLQIRQPQ